MSLRRWEGEHGLVIARGLRRGQACSGRLRHLDQIRARSAAGASGSGGWSMRRASCSRKSCARAGMRRPPGGGTRRLMKRAGRLSKRNVTDGPGSCAAAKHEAAPDLERRAHQGLDDRAENSHPAFRSHERAMRGHRPPGGPQRFAPMPSAVRDRFVPAAALRMSAAPPRDPRRTARGRRPPQRPASFALAKSTRKSTRQHHRRTADALAPRPIHGVGGVAAMPTARPRSRLPAPGAITSGVGRAFGPATSDPRVGARSRLPAPV